MRLREGRFRAFLLTSFRNFMAKERDKARALKRGGGKPLLSIDVALGEARHVREPSDTLTPEALFERQWALTLLERAMEGLRREAVKAGREAELACLGGFLTGGEPQASYAEAGAQLGMNEVAVRAMVLRLRRRYGRLLRAEIADTLGFVYLRRELAEAALVQFDASLELAEPGSTGWATAQFHRGLALRQLGRPADAVAALEQALASGAEFADAQEAHKVLADLGNAGAAAPKQGS